MSEKPPAAKTPEGFEEWWKANYSILPMLGEEWNSKRKYEAEKTWLAATERAANIAEEFSKTECFDERCGKISEQIAAAIRGEKK